MLLGASGSGEVKTFGSLAVVADVLSVVRDRHGLDRNSVLPTFGNRAGNNKTLQ